LKASAVPAISKNRKNPSARRIDYEKSDSVLIFVSAKNNTVSEKPIDPNLRKTKRTQASERPKNPNLRKTRQYPKN
jgi:hypothetical protein